MHLIVILAGSAVERVQPVMLTSLAPIHVTQALTEPHRERELGVAREQR
jgi:hypothetical protein